MNRVAPGGYVYHVLNRANGRLRIFKKDEDFEAFFRCVRQAMEKHPIRILGWCLMGNHWHFVVWPREDDDLSKFFGYLSLLHSTRWQAAHQATGMGHVYQGRFKNFMIQQDEHLEWVLRYVERNPLRANLVKDASTWRWSSLQAWLDKENPYRDLLTDWPIDRPRNWVNRVNDPQTVTEANAIATSIQRGRPLGTTTWTRQVATRNDLQSTLRPRGRQPGWRKKRDQ